MVRSLLGNRSPLVYSSALPVKRQIVFIKVSPEEDRLSTATTAKKYKHILFLYRQNGAIRCNCSHYRWARTWPTASYPLLRKDIPLAEGHMLVHTLYPCLCLPGSTYSIASAQAPGFRPFLFAIRHRIGYHVLLYSVVPCRSVPSSPSCKRVQLHFRNTAWVEPLCKPNLPNYSRD